MDLLDRTLFHIGDSAVTFLSLIAFGLILIVTIVVSLGLKKLLLKRVFPKHNISEGIARAYSSIIYYVIFVTGFLIALNSAGINISILFAGGAALLVGIGFGIQNITNNFISGIILLFERPIKEGDFIEVDGILGTVVSISARSTKVRTNTDVMIIVPNSKFLENKIINRSYIEYTQIDVPLNVAFDTKLEKITPILTHIALEHPKVLKEPAPAVSVSDIEENFIKVRLWVTISDNKAFGIIRSDLYKRILEEFAKEGIEFPVPRREVRTVTGNAEGD
jgi:small-conductance mechanosensitive channel